MSALRVVPRRPVSLSLFVAALLCALLVALTVGPRAEAAADHQGHGQAADLPTHSQVVFHDQMRKLWEDHVTWTRLAIVTFADGSKGFAATADRLLQNQSDIGAAVAPFYGKAAGQRLTALLHDHITIAVELLKAAKAGATAAFAKAKTRWYRNADQISRFLASANPRFWPVTVVRSSMRTHLDQTLVEASAELTGKYQAGVAAYDEIHHHILQMADLLSSGIIHLSPTRFRH